MSKKLVLKKLTMQVITAMALSLFVPGLGHFYLGVFKKGISLLAMDVVIVTTLIFSKSLIIKWLMGGVFFAVMIPALVETFMLVGRENKTALSDSPVYVTFMLLTTGFGALPLLWQSQYSKRAKILWTIAVAVLAVLFFSALYFCRAPIESFLKEISY